MFSTFRNAWKIEDLRKKIMFTFFILLIFCIGRAIPAPFLDIAKLNEGLKSSTNPGIEIINMMTGGGFTSATLFALGATPYINASIIVQLLQVVIPALERWSKEGEEGRKKINKLTKGVSIVLGLGLSIAYYFMLRGQSTSPLIYLFSASATDANPTPLLSAWLSTAAIVATFMAGSMLVMWLADQIDAKGIGSGMSLIIFWGIISNFSSTFGAIVEQFGRAAGTLKTTAGEAIAAEPGRFVAVPLIILVFFGLFLLIIVTNAAERRIPVQYAKRVVGRKMYGGQNTNIPIKVNLTGVLPVIFASSFLALPTTILSFMPNINEEGFWYKFLNFFSAQSWGYAVLFGVLILAFNYFYVTVQYNPIQMANDLRKNSGMIPGIRPGQPTTSFIQKVISKITFIGGIFLIIVALTPIIITKVTSLLFSDGINIALGGTSLLIVVGVAIEISNTLESYMLMRHHKGFLE